ncbi:hypothetical protein T09_4163 [Trichinella sp. T9]|nr:hypothetical protein T09_4163 [Trichinella sp. T9]
MINYVPRKNSNVLLLTSYHSKLKQGFKRPNIINEYNLGKGCVDSRDARIEDFSCKQKTNRYIMLMLYFIVEVCINNGFLLMRHQQSYQKTKKCFMRELSAQLVKQHIEMRYQNEKIHAQSEHAFIHYRLPQNHKCYRYQL